TAFARAASAIAWGEGPYHMRVVEDGFALNTEIQIDGEPNFQPVFAGSEAAFRVRIPISASDPFLYGDPRETLIQGYQRTPSLLWDTFGQGYTNAEGEQVLGWSEPHVNPLTIMNAGTVPAYPVFVVTADSYSGVGITLGGNAVEYGGALVQASPLTLDYRQGSATINGRPQSAELTLRGWEALPPGSLAVHRVDFLDDRGARCAAAAMRVLSPGHAITHDPRSRTAEGRGFTRSLGRHHSRRPPAHHRLIFHERRPAGRPHHGSRERHLRLRLQGPVGGGLRLAHLECQAGNPDPVGGDYAERVPAFGWRLTH